MEVSWNGCQSWMFCFLLFALNGIWNQQKWSIGSRLFSPSLQESQWREFKIGSNEIVSSKFVSSLILVFFFFQFSLSRKPIMNPFLMVQTLIFAYYLQILVILQLVFMYFSTEWYFSQMSFSLAFQFGIKYFSQLPYFLFTYFIVIPLQFQFHICIAIQSYIFYCIAYVDLQIFDLSVFK